MADDFAEPTALRRALEQAIELSARTRAFLASPIGRAICERAEQQRADALEALHQTNPYDGAAVAQAQLQVRAIDTAMRWLAAMIEEGDAADFEIAQYEDPPGD